MYFHICLRTINGVFGVRPGAGSEQIERIVNRLRHTTRFVTYVTPIFALRNTLLEMHPLKLQWT